MKTRTEKICVPISRTATLIHSEFGTAKVVKIVLPSRLNLVLLSAYQASGLGLRHQSRLV